jgi:hypothetical protein
LQLCGYDRLSRFAEERSKYDSAVVLLMLTQRVVTVISLDEETELAARS